MFLLRHLHPIFLLLLLVSPLSASDRSDECGTILEDWTNEGTIYVHCQSLSGLTKAEVHDIVESVLSTTSTPADEIQVIFLKDVSVLDRDTLNQSFEERSAKWGDAFVGMYHTNSGVLMYRSSSDGQWRKLDLGVS